MLESAKNFGQFVVRILSTLSPTSWLPSATLVLGAVYIVEVQDNDASPTKAVEVLSAASASEFVSFAVAVVLVTVAIQPFQFTLIRWLEGYWGHGRIGRWAAKQLTEHHRKRLKALEQEHLKRSREAVTPEMSKRALEFKATLGPAAEGNPPRKAGDAADGDDDQGQPAGDVVRLSMARSSYPSDGRLMPTRLGNVLRYHEEIASSPTRSKPSEVRRIVLEEFHRVPAPLRELHDLHRGRIDTYCTLVFVWALLGAWSFGWLLGEGIVLSLTLVPVLMAVVSYSAAIAAADGYGDAIQAISNVVRLSDTDAAPADGEPSAA